MPLTVSITAARSLPQGRLRDTVEYGGNALSGAGAGAAAGAPLGLPGMAVGAVIGGVAGGVKTYLDKSGEKKAWSKEWETSERRFQENRDWKRQFDSLTDVGKNFKGLAEKIKAAEAELEKYRRAEEKIVKSVSEFGAKGEYENAAHQRESLGMNRARQEQLEGAIKQMKALGEDSKTPRADTSALDALSKLGGSFAGGGGTSMRELEKNGRDQLEVLKSIDRKSGGTVWR
jgi:predicted RNase H-like nuclease (RuvC/YqgF family)